MIFHKDSASRASELSASVSRAHGRRALLKTLSQIVNEPVPPGGLPLFPPTLTICGVSCSCGLQQRETCRGNVHHHFLACTCLSGAHTAARHKHTLACLMSCSCCRVVAAQQACTAPGTSASPCPAAGRRWQPLPQRSPLRATGSPQAAGAPGAA